MAWWRSGNAAVCKTVIRRFESDPGLNIDFGIYAFKNNETLYINSTFKKWFGYNTNFTQIIERMNDYFTISDIFKKIRKLLCFDMKNPQEYNDFYGEIEKMSEHNNHYSSLNNIEQNINIPDIIKNKKAISHNRSFSEHTVTYQYTLKKFIENLIQENSVGRSIDDEPTWVISPFD